MDTADPLPLGLYEQIVTRELRRRLPVDRAETDPLSKEMSELLVDHVARSLERALRAPGFGIAESVALCNRLLDQIEAEGPAGAVSPGDEVPTPAEVLNAIRLPSRSFADSDRMPRPETPLREDALFVNAPHEPGLAPELRAELLSADSVSLLCAFVVWTGVRIVLDELREIRHRGVPVRVITTTYTGTTDPRALDELAKAGAEIKVSYDTRMTRLHAKAWLFERASGFSTAYIGSSNLTHSALHEGIEWNVRLSQAHSPDLLDRFRAAFETYWSDDHFVPYDASQFKTAIKRERTGRPLDLTLFDIRPYEYQRAMLEQLEVERERHGRWRNLVVAATGTGKTVVAALDYRRFAERWGGARLLFVAHRHEILEQSRHLFRHVMRDGSFGELLAGGHRPDDGKHVFASIQTLANVDLETIDPAAYDVVIVDEFHHAEAPTYRRLLEHIRPRLLLGLTATPERADERDVLRWFDGTIAVELRLWDALDQGLLCPFQYFGVADDVDLRDLEWKRTGYDLSKLSALYTGNDVRTSKILQSVHDLIDDTSRMRALAFCVSVEHAEYMAQRFNEAGIAARAITGKTDIDERRDVVRKLRTRDINVIATVDVFNEGVDIPEVDTVLLLRPTESATVFIQQLGRGLRLADEKPGLTVLDFIGQQHRMFRFDTRLQALTGVPARKLADAVEQGFPHLPPGCYIHLDRVASSIVLNNLKDVTVVRRQVVVRELRQCGDTSLAEFLRVTGRCLDDIYKAPLGWMSLRRSAGLGAPPLLPGDDSLIGAVSRMLHIDDPERLLMYRLWLGERQPPDVSTLTPREVRLLQMLHLDLRGGRPERMALSESLAEVWQHEAVRLELCQVLDVLSDQASSLVIERGDQDEPLGVHARYTRAEALGALGASTAEKPSPMREGVIWIPDCQTDAFFVTLQKAEKMFSASTMYRDYAISPNEFHWESQSTTSVTSPTGRRYINQRRDGTRVLFFVRETSDQRAFLYVGSASYLRHTGDRPIAITWQLEHDLPAEFFLAARAAG
jgi:superfamily II DNA or RNA helicase/HKD family nuclease